MSLAVSDGKYQTVHVLLLRDHLDRFLKHTEECFLDRDDVVLVASGESLDDSGFYVLEFDDCQIDVPYLRFLESDESVIDVCIY